MGVDGLSGYLRREVRHAYTRIPISSLVKDLPIQHPSKDSFKNNVGIAIDVSWLGYQAIRGATIRSMNFLEIDVEMQLWYWENHIFNTLRQLLEYGITPLLVLDGKPPEEKQATQLRRREQGQKNRQRFETLLQEWNDTPQERRTQLQLELAQKALLNTVYPPYEFRQHLRKLLVQWGFPVWQSIGEADPLCAALAIDGVVSAVMTNDHDLLVYGVNFLITDLDLPNGQVEVLNRQVVLDTLKLTHAQFQVWCFYCGTDYNNGIPNIGVIRGLRLARGDPPVDIGEKNVEQLRRMFAPRPHLTLLAEQTIYRIDPIQVLRGFTEWYRSADESSKNVKNAQKMSGANWESFQQKLATWYHPPMSVVSCPPVG
jgi:5'-3' exonuclease